MASAIEDIRLVEKRTFINVAPEAAFQKGVAIASTFTPEARRKCAALGEISQTRCNGQWGFHINEDLEFNAFAFGKNNIALNTGLAGYLKSDSEWAFVIAHELSHHFANHLAEQRRDAYLGELIGGTINAAIYSGIASAAGVECDPRYRNCSHVNDLIREGYNSGAETGRGIAIARYSREQEVEADTIAADILRSAGYDLTDITSLRAFMGSLNRSATVSKFGDTHPSGPERLAQYKLIAVPEMRPRSKAASPVQDSLKTQANRAAVSRHAPSAEADTVGTEEPRRSTQTFFEIPSIGAKLENTLVGSRVPFVECTEIEFDDIWDEDLPERCPFWTFGGAPSGYKVVSIQDNKFAEKFKLRVGDLVLAYRQEGFWTSPKVRLDEESGKKKIQSLKNTKIASLLVERSGRAFWVKRRN
jgi:hypothetical protein